MNLRSFWVSLIFALQLMAFVSPVSAQEVALTVRQFGCGPPRPPMLWPYRTREERDQVTATWIGPDQLEVQAWDDETAEEIIDRDSAKVSLAGKTLTLSYRSRQVPVAADKPILTCLFAVKLVFAVMGVPHSHYKIQVERHKAIEIDG